MSTFNYDQIMNAINKIQEAHPVSFAYDATSFEDLEAVDAIKSVIDKAIEQAEKNSEIHIICELAKNYMMGVKPTYGHNQPKWIPCEEWLPNYGVPVLGTFAFQGGNGCLTTERIWDHGYDIWSNACGMTPIAWMPLPEPFRKEGGIPNEKK